MHLQAQDRHAAKMQGKVPPDAQSPVTKRSTQRHRRAADRLHGWRRAHGLHAAAGHAVAVPVLGRLHCRLRPVSTVPALSLTHTAISHTARSSVSTSRP